MTSIRIDSTVLEESKDHVRNKWGEGKFSEFTEKLLALYLNSEGIMDIEEFGVSEDDIADLRERVSAVEEQASLLEVSLREEQVLQTNTDNTQSNTGEESGNAGYDFNGIMEESIDEMEVSEEG